MMKIVVAIDSLKGSLTSIQAGEAIEKGIKKVDLEAEVVIKPLADGGEGCLDAQTAMGKAPIGVAKLAKKYGKLVLGFSGAVTKGATACNEAGIDAYFPIVRSAVSLEDAMKKKRNLSFNRFESEQINNLSHLVTNIQEDYVLNIDESNISSSYLPLKGIDALSYMKTAE